MSDSYVLRLERLRVELRDILRSKGFVLPDDVDLTTMIPKVEGIGAYDILDSINNGVAYTINDTEGHITAIKSGLYNGTKITSATLPELTNINSQNAFNGCTSLTTVNLAKITSIPRYTFVGCTNLTDVTLPAIVTIYGWCFENCTSLTTLDLPSTINFIGSYNENHTFNNCYSFKNLIIRKTGSVLTITADGPGLFSNTPFRNGVGGTVYVPDDLVSAYEAADGWKSLESTTFKGLSELPE